MEEHAEVAEAADLVVASEEASVAVSEVAAEALGVVEEASADRTITDRIFGEAGFLARDITITAEAVSADFWAC